MKSIRVLSMLACALCLGEALVSVSSAQTPAKGSESNPIVTISTGRSTI